MRPWLHVLGDFALHDRHDTCRDGYGRRAAARLPGRSRRAGAAACTSPVRCGAGARPSVRRRTCARVLCRLPRPGGRSLVTATGRHLRLADDVVVDLASARAAIERVRAGETAGAHDAVTADLSADLLPGWDEDWLVVEREHHRQRRLHALEALSAVAVPGSDRFDEALGAALASVAGEPLRESAHRRVIEVHLAEGNPAEALRQYESYRRLVRDELGLAPDRRRSARWWHGCSGGRPTAQPDACRPVRGAVAGRRDGSGPRTRSCRRRPTAGHGVGAALLLRVWRDGDVVRARLLGVEPPHRTVATAQGTDAICAAVRAWLCALEGQSSTV